jgi:50S ribosomal subunit-associated GTPase HflX
MMKCLLTHHAVMQVEAVDIFRPDPTVCICSFCSSQVKAVAAIRPDPTVCISGLTGEGLPDLMSMLASSLTSGMEEVEVLLPYPQGDLLEQLHVTGQVLSSEFQEAGGIDDLL